ncbi:hypothetical protein [Devosia sp.]|uniref:hypothetical protein n=1 Tax=Devosia sp. TaxID=1871048 RepID=UPI0019DA1166|nr:hypothetical protein [Devosia sp.]MBE0580626.1 hypothetical protein [Devosia sp.]
MKKTIIATTIATLLAATSLPALAQDAGVQVDTGAGVTVDTPAVDAAVGADANANANANAGGMSDNTYGSVVSSIQGSADVDLSTVTDESKVTIVLLSSLQGDAATEAAALDEALSANADGMTTLHTNIDGNATIKAKLEAEGHATSDVVAVKSNADGSVIVYVDDRA